MQLKEATIEGKLNSLAAPVVTVAERDEKPIEPLLLVLKPVVVHLIVLLID
jgi:hypothetical protein